MRNHEAGLTLLEVLVVLSIVAVMAGSAVALLPRGDTAPSAEHAMQNLIFDLNAVAGKTAALALPLELDWSAEGYRLTAGARVVSRDLRKGVRLRGDLRAPYRVSAVGVPTTLSPLQLTLSDRSSTNSIHFNGVRATAIAGASNAPE